MARPYVRALSAALDTAALPYGYTLTVWASGQATIHHRGAPNVGQIALFVAGAAVAYGALRMVAREREREVSGQIGSPHVLRAGAVHVVAIAAAIGLAALLARIGSGAAWPLASFAATLAYILVSTVELLLEASREAS